MKQYNPATGKVEGKESKNFYFNTKNNSIEGEFEKKRKESNLILADDVIRDINGNPIGKKEKVVPFKIDINPVEEKIKIVEYNKSLKNITDEANSFVLNGNNLIVRLFKHDPYIMGKDDPTILLSINPIVVPYQDTKDGGTIKAMEAPLQFIQRGVIVNMSGTYSETFSKNFKVGDVVDIKNGVNLMAARFWINPIDQMSNNFDNYFSFNENLIEKKVLHV